MKMNDEVRKITKETMGNDSSIDVHQEKDKPEKEKTNDVKKDVAEEMEVVMEEQHETEADEKEMQPSEFWRDDRGVGVIEIVLILVILIGLVLVFKEQITSIVNDAFASISGNAGKILK